MEYYYYHHESMSDGIPQPQRKRWYKRWWLWTLIILGLLIVGGIAAGMAAFKAQQKASYDYLSDTVTVERRDIDRTISTSGTVVPDAVASLSTLGSGTVTAVNVSVGQTVKKDDVLVTIDADIPGTPKEVKATFDGRVIAVNTFVGDRVSPVAPVVEIGYQSSHIEFYASDSEAVELEEGQDAAITVPAFENGKTEFVGAVTFVDVKKQTASLSNVGQLSKTGYLVKVSTGDMPMEVTGLVGLTVDMDIITKAKTDVLSIENAAIQYDEDGKAFVYQPVTIDEAFIARASQEEDVTTVLEKTDVTVGFEGDEYSEITSGLDEGQKVLFYIPAQKTASPF